MKERFKPEPVGNFLVLVGFFALCGLAWLLIDSMNQIAACLH